VTDAIRKETMKTVNVDPSSHSQLRTIIDAHVGMIAKAASSHEEILVGPWFVGKFDGMQHEGRTLVFADASHSLSAPFVDIGDAIQDDLLLRFLGQRFGSVRRFNSQIELAEAAVDKWPCVRADEMLANARRSEPARLVPFSDIDG
jgi:hypothetical protein